MRAWCCPAGRRAGRAVEAPGNQLCDAGERIRQHQAAVVEASGHDAHELCRQVASAPPVLTVTPATLAYVANSVSRTYGATDSLFTGSVTGFVNGDTLDAVTSGNGPVISEPLPCFICPSEVNAMLRSPAVAIAVTVFAFLRILKCRFRTVAFSGLQHRTIPFHFCRWRVTLPSPIVRTRFLL